MHINRRRAMHKIYGRVKFSNKILDQNMKFRNIWEKRISKNIVKSINHLKFYRLKYFCFQWRKLMVFLNSSRAVTTMILFDNMVIFFLCFWYLKHYISYRFLFRIIDKRIWVQSSTKSKKVWILFSWHKRRSVVDITRFMRIGIALKFCSFFAKCFVKQICSPKVRMFIYTMNKQ